MKKHFYGRKRISSPRLVISYTVVLLLPIIFSLIAYMNISRAMSAKTKEANLHILTNYTSYIDNVIKRTLISTPSALTNDELLSINNDINSISTQTRYNLAYSDYTGRIASSSEYIKNFYVYYPHQNTIFTSKNLMDSESFFNARYDNILPDFSQWQKLVLSSDKTKTQSMVCKNGESLMFYNKPSVAFANGMPVYNIILELNLEKMRTDCSLRNDFYIIGDSGDLFSGALQNLNSEFIDKYIINGSTDTVKFNGTKSVINKIHSEIAPLSYVTITPKNTYFRELSKAWASFLTATILSLLFGVAVIVYSARKNNEPLLRILALFSGKETDEPHENKVSYEYIIEHISRTLDENKNYVTKLSQQNTLFRQNLLRDIIEGRGNSEEAYKKQLSFIDLKWNKEYFAIIALHPYSVENISSEYGNDSNKVADLIASTLCSQILTKHNYNADAFNMNNLVLFILNLDESECANLNEELHPILASVINIAKMQYHFPLMCAVSVPCRGIDQLSNAYSEVLFCMEYAGASNDEIVFYSDMPHRGSQANIYTLDTEQQIINCLELQNYAKCHSIAEKMILKMESSNAPKSATLLFACDLLNTFYSYKCSDTADNKAHSIIKAGLDSITDSQQSSTAILMTVLNTINKYLTCLEQYSGGTSSSYLKGRHDDIKEYIDSNYDNPNLCVSELGEIFGLNSSYLSKLFKEKYGIVLSEYITKKRIDAAKTLLLSTGKTNSEIAEIVGFTNTRTFLRSFSKFSGMTPQTFRDKTGEDNPDTDLNN